MLAGFVVKEIENDYNNNMKYKTPEQCMALARRRLRAILNALVGKIKLQDLAKLVGEYNEWYLHDEFERQVLLSTASYSCTSQEVETMTRRIFKSQNAEIYKWRKELGAMCPEYYVNEHFAALLTMADTNQCNLNGCWFSLECQCAEPCTDLWIIDRNQQLSISRAKNRQRRRKRLLF